MHPHMHRSLSDGSGEELTLTHKHSSSLLCPSTSSRLRSHASTAPSSTARPVSCLDHTVYNRRFAVLGVVCPPAFVSPFPLSLSLMALCFSCLPHSPSLFSAPPSAFIGRPSAASGAWNIVDDVTHGGEATSIPIDTRCLHESRHTCEWVMAQFTSHGVSNTDLVRARQARQDTLRWCHMGCSCSFAHASAASCSALPLSHDLFLLQEWENTKRSYFEGKSQWDPNWILKLLHPTTLHEVEDHDINSEA